MLTLRGVRFIAGSTQPTPQSCLSGPFYFLLLVTILIVPTLILIKFEIKGDCYHAHILIIGI